MALYPITPPAGIIKNGTDYANTGRWVDGDLVRFENGYLKPIGGWREFSRNTPLNYLADNTGTVATTSGSATITVTTATAKKHPTPPTFSRETLALLISKSTFCIINLN